MESLSRPLHRRKLSNANSFSSRNPYDDVLSGPPKFGAPTFSSRVQDYSEIFGVSRASSIPILDVSALDEPNASADYQSSKVDYSKIFGGFSDEDVGVSYEELFAKPKGGKKTSKKGRTPPETGSHLPGTDNLNSPESIQSFVSEVSCQSFDGMKQFNMSYHKTTQRSKDGTNGTTHIAELHAVPGYTCFIDEGTATSKKECVHTKAAVISDVHCNMYPNEAKVDVKPGGKTVSQLIKKQTSEAADKFKRGYSWDGSYLNGEFFDVNEVNRRSPSSKVPPRSDTCQGHSKRYMSSTFDAAKGDASEATAGDSSPPFFDEELDVNSAAVVSAAALRKAIEKAQESIRLAKEIMERKRDGLQNGLDQSLKNSLKVKDKRHSKIACKGNKIQEKDARETCGRVDSVFQVLDVTKRKDALKNGEIVFDLKDGEDASTAGRVVGKMQRVNWGSAGECEAAVWLSELVNPGKHRTKNMGFEHADGKDNIVQSIDKRGCKYKESERAAETLETQEVVDMNRNVNGAHMGEGVEEKMYKLESAWFMHVPKENEKSGTAQENEESGNQRKGFYEDENCLNEERKVEIFEKKPDFQELKKDYIKRLDESQKLERSHKEQEEVFEEAKIEKKVEGVYAWQADEDRLTKINGDEDIRRGNVEVYHWLENENKLKEVFGGIVGNGKQQKDANGGEDTKRSLDDGYDLEIDEKRSTDTHDWEEDEKSPEEQCKWEENGRFTRAYEYEAIESIQSKTDQLKENERRDITHEAIYGKNLDMTACVCDSNDSNRVSEPHQVYIDEIKNKNMETSQEAVACEERGSMVGITEEFSEFEENEEPEEVKAACNVVLNAAGFVQVVTEEIEIENKTIKASKEAVAVTVACNEMFNVAGLLHSVTEENEIKNKGKNASEDYLSDDNAANVCSSNMIYIQQQSEQNDKESEPATSLKDDMDMPIHGSQENEENSEDGIIFIVEEEKSDSETACDTQWFENAQEIEVSQVVNGSKKQEKSMERDQEINTCQNMEIDQEINRSQNMESDQEIRTGQNMGSDQEIRTCQNVESDQEIKPGQDIQMNEEDINKSSTMEKKETKGTTHKELDEKEHLRKIEEANKREREREKDRIAVERAIREARERAFAEARERAERAAMERATAEVRHRVTAEAREKLQKASAGTKLIAEQSSIEAKLRGERAAVERATAEARERALEKALSQKTFVEARSQADRYVTDNASRENGLRHSFSSSDLERFDGTNYESAQRRKARLERHQRIMERAAKALAEKNMRDHHAQKEQAERNRLAEILDADIKRWASGKEGNLRALLSTLQYILGPDSGWQPISLTDIIATNAIKKAYRKATLCVHPDKLQQRGASIQQKYICEKVFDLLKAAWNRFNSEER